MPSLQQALRTALQRSRQIQSRRPPSPVVVLGVGSDLHSDDAAGVRVAERVAALRLRHLLGVVGGTAPENVTGKLREIRPAHVVVVDAAHLGADPGTIRVLGDETEGGASCSTHTLPLDILAAYLKKDLGCRVIIVGIEPSSLAFGETLSPPVASAVDELVGALEDVMRA